MTAVQANSAPTSASDPLADLYADWTELMTSDPEMGMRLLRSLFEEWHQATSEPTAVTYREDTLGGVPGIWVTPIGADPAKVILYTHGGGFAVGSAASHRKIAGHLAKELGTTAFVLDYRRAPEHSHPAQVEDGVAVFRALLDNGIAAEDIVTTGDSAGGNLAIAIPLALRQAGDPMPGRVIAFSPWLDMEITGTTLESNRSTDNLVHADLLRGMAAGVLGDAVSPTDPLANPLYADFTGYPRLYVNASNGETLLDNTTRLVDRVRSAGVDVTVSLIDDAQHVFPMAAGRDPRADAELSRIGEWFRR
ncbi:esterase [Gordonia paraffinivorans]|uniref:alpha/beta hydrolase n=1 Tax=Gordonia paraffinivorans TaxID=175628 RepID=UPI000D612A2C|nr:alpha/beta hydrolase [Gordonia paraffinivorans]PWD42105.1 esterase [Gordonia paraffinivorans]